MSFLLPLRTGWRLAAQDLEGQPEAPAFTLPGAEKLAGFSELLGLPEQEECRSVPFPVPGLVPGDADCGAILSRELRFGAVPKGQVLLHFPLLRGTGRILLDNAEIALFADGPLTLDLTAPSRRKRKQLLELCFDAVRPAGIPVLPYLTSTPGAHFLEIRLIPDGSRIRGSALIHADEPGTYSFSVRAPGREESTRTVTLGTHEEKRLDFSCAASREMLAFLQLKEGSLCCDRRVLRCGTLSSSPTAFLPLSAEDSLLSPKDLCRTLQQLGIRAVSLGKPAPPCLYTALSDAGIRVLQGGTSEESRAELRRIPGICFKETPLPGDTAAFAAWQLCGLSSCPRALPEKVPDPELLRQVCGADSLSADAETRLKKLLLRLRLDGAALGLYAGPIAFPGILTNPLYEALTEAAASPHVAAAPLFGAWFAGSHFSCRLGILNAPEGSRGHASLHLKGVCLAEIDFSAAEQPILEAVLPDETGILSLETSLTLPDGITLCGEPLPVPVGKRVPLQSFAANA